MRVFNEAQRFDQWWVQLMNLGMFALLCYMCYTWYIAKEAVGNVPANDTTVQAVTILSLLFGLGILYIFRLDTVMDEKGIRYRFFPLRLGFKTISWNEIANCHVRKYRPISEYGGWGYRGWSKKNRAVNIKGDQGIQIVFDNGDRLLIGTQKPTDAQKVIERYFPEKGPS